ncbi:glycoside hydrolase family 3 C-terminal domain-containing protein [Gordonia polyisoprenivorans]|uniref:glycoside hydrolase family 3 C-terminal domain-containing protein n=1 Tax=Gordonia polyisoprenivorans TaxID=84595 RepID=UPI001AD6EBDA|nr:glycoside hydrolase family 3 C-terminal domain-containing protein [Gordonia polyisoprenivorans]QTI67688.1 glycoside hydrolase family 3 C-terminal domain-containing protein [Gordonia polyisoprenivorans]
MTQQPDGALWSAAEQARLTSGHDFWTTESVADVPSILMTDGPHGLRKQDGATDHLGVSGSVPATCFPPAVGVAQTWSPALARRVGTAIADEARAHGVGVVLGPGVNLKRSVRGGRNFEYFSEDPHLTAELGGAWVHGLQARGVGASLKHFAVNNQETDRMRISADVDERTLHELYLRAFRTIVIREQPWTVMCSYNRINGVHASQHRELLTEILRDQWGFAGAVISDWGAVADRVASLAAGLDLTMPSPGPDADAAVVDAVADGRLAPEALTSAADRVAALARTATAHAPTTPETADLDAHHAVAREVAGRAIVLLRNDDDLLPLTPTADLAVIGELATHPRYQGGGSSHVHATRVDVPLEEIRARAGAGVGFAAGYRLGGETDADGTLLAEAVSVARSASTVVLFLGLADEQESEGFDRADIELPPAQLALAEAIVAANRRTVIVLAHGGVLRLSSLTAPALLDGALLGQAVGAAIADVLFGDVNPSGRLAETVPERLSDTPDHLSFPGESGHVLYGEGPFIGYRWYDARELPVTFPFGHGLSYTTFEYRDLEVHTTDDGGLRVAATITNTGARAGREVVQVYLGAANSAPATGPTPVTMPTPVTALRELKAFTDVDLDPGRSTRVEVTVTADDLSRWDLRTHAFVVRSGRYTVSVGASSRDIRLTAEVDVVGDDTTGDLTLESSIAEVLADPVAAEAMTQIAGALTDGADTGEGMDLVTIMGSVPVGRLVDFSAGALPREVLQDILDRANATH